MSISRHPFDRVFTASVGISNAPVDDEWDARERSHIWFATRSTQLSTGDHLFALGAGRRSSVLGLYEITSPGTSHLRNPWDDPRWPFAVKVRALASVPAPEATGIPGLTAPRGSAPRIRRSELIDALYAHVDRYEINDPDESSDHPQVQTGAQHDPTTPTPGAEATRQNGRETEISTNSGTDSNSETRLRDPRPFDPDQPPAPRGASATHASMEQRDVLQEKAVAAHHHLLARLHAWVTGQHFKEVLEIPGAIDLYAVSPGGQKIIFEAKTISGHNELHQTRSALAQLLEYRVTYGHAGNQLCLVCDQAISPRRAGILDQLGIAVIALPDKTPQAQGTQAERLLARRVVTLRRRRP